MASNVLQCPDFTDSMFQTVLVQFAAHPGNFIFLPVKYKNKMKKLRAQMMAYYGVGALPEVPAERVVPNKLFAAKWLNEWYRVVVTFAPKDNRVQVRLCDFGIAASIPLINMRELAPEFYIYPFMAVKGKLAGVKPKHGDWSVRDGIRFATLVVNQILTGIVVHTQLSNENPMDMVVTLTLVDTESDEDEEIDIAEILISNNIAVRA